MSLVKREYRDVVSDNRRWEHFNQRPGDIFVCTPAKCGTTWTQTIVNSLLWPNGDSPGPVIALAPWFDARFFTVEETVAGLDAQTTRRSIKTHTPADGIPWFDDCQYIVVGRDARDAFMSWTNHRANMKSENIMALAVTAVEDGIAIPDRMPSSDIHEMFVSWLEDGNLFNHIATFWARRSQPNVLFVHYDDLKADLDAEMRRIAHFLEIEVPDSLWPAVIDRCTFAAMKARPDEIGDFERLFKGGADSFLFKGTNGRWRDVLTEDELAACEKRAVELLPPDANAWLTRS